MAVAKSYKDLATYGEPFEENGKMYVVVITARGAHKKVRWYTDAEYAKMYPDDAPKFPSKEFGICGGRKTRPTKEVLGFKEGYIWVFKGDTYPLVEWFRENGANFRTFWGWNFTSEQELPNLPAGIEAKKLMWESVAFVDEDVLRPQSAIDEAMAELIYDESPSTYVGAVGDRLDLTLTVKKAIELADGYYGPSTMHIFTDEEGNEYVWTTGARKLTEGETYFIKGTVKDHKIYKKTKQTVLTRCIVK